jgi:hypothetical protein
MAQPPPSRHGNAAPRPRRRRLSERGVSGGRSGHGAPQAIDAQGLLILPVPVVHGRSRHGAAEALAEARNAADRESGAGLTVDRRREPSARQRGQMAAGGVAMAPLSEAEGHGRDRREDAVAPGDIPALPAHR